MNRPTLRTVLVLACAALTAGLLASCGDSADKPDSAAATALDQTLAATSKLDSAHLKASFQLDPEGLLALGGPISARVSGPFDSGAKGELTRFELAVAGTLARRDLHARATSTGKRLFPRIDGRDYGVDRTYVGKLRSGDRAASSKKHKGLASLGLDPTSWIDDPREQGSEVVGGVQSTRIAGDIDVKALLDDVAKLLGGDDGLLTPKLRKQIEDAVTSAKVDVWTGAKDKILRQLVAAIDFKFKDGSPISGLDGGKVTLRLNLDDVNAATVDAASPKHPRPLADLTGEGGLGALLSGLGAGILAGTGGGDGGDAFLKCLSSSSATSDIVRCASKLAPKP